MNKINTNLACVIVNFNRKKETLRCIKSLVADSASKHIVLVDNGSSDQEELGKEIKSIEKIHFIPLNENFGFAEGNNRGIKYALGLDSVSTVFLINNDAWVADGALSKMNDFMNANKDVAMLSPKIYFPDHKTIWSAGCGINYLRLTGTNRGRKTLDDGLYNNIAEIPAASGCALMLRASVFDSVGFFDSNLFCYFEDLDFCIRARIGKNKIVYFPKAHILHEGSLTAGGEFDGFSSYYRYRNRLIVLKKHGNILQILFNMVFFPVLMVRDFFYYMYNKNFHAYGRLWKGFFDFLIFLQKNYPPCRFCRQTKPGGMDQSPSTLPAEFHGKKSYDVCRKNILILKLSAIGDMLMATPAIREIRRQYPSAKIFHLIGKWSSEIMSANPNIDELIVVDEKIFWKKKIIPVVKLLLELRKKKIDIVFNMHWSEWMNLFVFAVGAKERIGFTRSGSGIFLTKKIPYSEGEKGPHQIEQYLALTGNPGSAISSDVKKTPEIFFRKGEIEEYNNKFRDFFAANGKDIIAVAPGGGSNPKDSMPGRRWHCSGYVELVNKIVKNTGYSVILLGRGDDREVVNRILSENKNKRITGFVDRLNLHENAYMLQNSLILVCNDSALMHLASAVGTKCLSIFGPTAPYDKAPQGREHIYMYSAVSCSPCYKFGAFPECDKQHCFDTIKPDEVFKVLQKMVSDSDTHG